MTPFTTTTHEAATIARAGIGSTVAIVRRLKVQPDGRHHPLVFVGYGIARFDDPQSGKYDLPIPLSPGKPVNCIQLRGIAFGDGKYAVGDDGNVYDVSGHDPIMRAVSLTKKGYEQISLRHNGVQNGFRVNRLVAEAFYGSPLGGEVCRHLDNNRRNNKPENLDWGTPKQNSLDAVAAGSFSGERASKAKLTAQDVQNILVSPENQFVLAAEYGVGQPTISKIKSGRRWSQDTSPPPPRNRPVNFSRHTLTPETVRVCKMSELSAREIRAGALPYRADDWVMVALCKIGGVE
jgi:hypothetical protein